MYFLKKIGFENYKAFLKCSAIGILAGAINGLFGSGGGLLLVPFYTDIMKLEQRQAFATSVFTVLIVSIVSIITYSQKVSIDLISIAPFLIGGAIGGIIGATILKRLPINIIRKVFALFILWAAFKALFL